MQASGAPRDGDEDRERAANVGPGNVGPGAAGPGSADSTDSTATAGPAHAVTAGLLVTLAVQNAVPPFATDMYSPAFPQVTESLGTTSALVGLTLTTFFIGMGVGQVLGGSISDHRGRRTPMILGGLLCALGGLVCALAPSVWVLIAGRLLQGLGGGAAAAVGRAVLVDLAHGVLLARAMTLLQAIGGLAPMVAPVLGGLITTWATWRETFWFLFAFGLVMMGLAWHFVPESLPPDRRHGGGIRRIVRGIRGVLRTPVFVGFMLTSAFSGFCMFAYISNSSYVLQVQKGLSPLQYSLFFAANATAAMLVALLNARLVGWVQPRTLIRTGLSLSALAVALLAASVLLWDTALVPTCVGFMLLISAQSFVFGNSAALALGSVPAAAGTASAVQGLVQSLASATSAPLATSGGGTSAVPMVVVMVVGVTLAWVSFLAVGRVLRGDEGEPHESD